MAVNLAAAVAAADFIDAMLDEWSEEDARTIWEWSGYSDNYPGRAERRAELLRIAQRDGWQIEVRKTRKLRALMRRAIVTRDIRALRLLLLLLATQRAAVVAAWLCGRDNAATPRAGHGAAAPVRGSPFGRLALASQGVPPD